MKNVYILTEEGREWTEDGLQYLTNTIHGQAKDDAELEFVMGAMYNIPTVLAFELEQHADAYVVVSREDGIVVAAGGFAEALSRNLTAAAMAAEIASEDAAFVDKTSWEIACEMIAKGPR